MIYTEITYKRKLFRRPEKIFLITLTEDEIITAFRTEENLATLWTEIVEYKLLSLQLWCDKVKIKLQKVR